MAVPSNIKKIAESLVNEISMRGSNPSLFAKGFSPLPSGNVLDGIIGGGYSPSGPAPTVMDFRSVVPRVPLTTGGGYGSRQQTPTIIGGGFSPAGPTPTVIGGGFTGLPVRPQATLNSSSGNVNNVSKQVNADKQRLLDILSGKRPDAIWYHGTTKEAADKIRKSGLLLPKTGLGDVWEKALVHVTNSFDDAVQRAKDNNGVVFAVKESDLLKSRGKVNKSSTLDDMERRSRLNESIHSNSRKPVKISHEIKINA